jgi:hypothetical protein
MRILYTDDEREIYIAGRGLKNLVHKSESKARSMLQRQNNNKFILQLSLTEIEKKKNTLDDDGMSKYITSLK